jgi:hypothetical protein
VSAVVTIEARPLLAFAVSDEYGPLGSIEAVDEFAAVGAWLAQQGRREPRRIALSGTRGVVMYGHGLTIRRMP